MFSRFFRTLFSREFSLIKKKPTFYLVTLAALSAVSFGLMFVLHFTIIPAFSHLKFDLGDVGAAIAAVILGPLSAIIVTLVKCLLYLPFDMGNMGVGVLSNFICSVFFVLTLSVVYHLRTSGAKQSPKRDTVFLAVAFVAGVLVETGIAMLSNWLLIVPLFIRVLDPEGHWMPQLLQTAGYIFGGVLPFNLIKFAIEAVAAFFLAKALLRILPRIVKGLMPDTIEEYSEKPTDLQIAEINLEIAKLEIEKIDKFMEEKQLVICPYCGIKNEKSRKSCSQCDAKLDAE
ncbi:hypothetical protein FACS1894211_14950 [Clostridia bacterium]|nr:hypothetical protein FACS1894211_14950 [Clostridia bacterium]